MDETQLKKALENIDVPEGDENAKKGAINLALAEFENTQKKNQKNRQGFSIFSRLMGNTNKDSRRKAMFDNKKMIYGGMATAMAVILVVGISVQQFSVRSGGGNASRETNLISAPVDGNNYSRIAQNITTSVKPKLFSKKEHRDATETKRPATVDFYGGRASDLAVAQSAPARSRMMAGDEAFVGGIVASPAPMGDEIAPTDAYKDVGRDQFEDFEENAVKLVSEEPVSTFSVDVDTSSYAFIRRQINNGLLPQKDAVRIEEMINYFDYDYPLPETREQPFEPSVTVVLSPWNDGNKLIHIGIKGYDIAPEEKPRSNLVFLLDVSGSMNSPDKLPLLKNSLKLLLETLSPDDTVSIVVYAGAAGTVLEPTKANERRKIIEALERLSAGGSTAGAEGIRQAYNLAEAHFDEEAVNRVILATDGDFNVGITNREELKDFIERKRESGIFLSVLGFGQGNYNDHLMQELAQNGNGVAAYIDNLNEARKVLVEEASSALFPIAKDVKIQIEFNPETVAEYRQIGYETRALNREDFNNDAVDAGDIGAGHTVTAIYEITPADGPRAIDESRYAITNKPEDVTAKTDFGNEYAFLKIRYKLPDEDTSNLITTPVTTLDERDTLQKIQCGPEQDCVSPADGDVRFSVAVASFGQLLKGGKYTGDMNYDDVIALAQQAKGADEFGYRAEFINMVRLAKSAAALQKN